MQLEFENILIRIWPLSILFLVILAILFWRKRRDIFYTLAFTVWGIYLLFFIDKVFYPIQVSGAYADAMRENLSFASQINLGPFSFNWHSGVERVLRDFVLNIILTIPFGFGIHFIWQIPQKRMYWLGLWLGLGIEITQLFISLILGFPYRVIDINDLIANLFGVWIGNWIFLGFAWVYQKTTLDYPKGKLEEYLDKVIGPASPNQSTN